MVKQKNSNPIERGIEVDRFLDAGLAENRDSLKSEGAV